MFVGTAAQKPRGLSNPGQGELHGGASADGERISDLGLRREIFNIAAWIRFYQRFERYGYRVIVVARVIVVRYAEDGYAHGLLRFRAMQGAIGRIVVRLRAVKIGVAQDARADGRYGLAVMAGGKQQAGEDGGAR